MDDQQGSPFSKTDVARVCIIAYETKTGLTASITSYSIRLKFI